MSTWRTADPLGRALYDGSRYVGMMETALLADLVVARSIVPPSLGSPVPPPKGSVLPSVTDRAAVKFGWGEPLAEDNFDYVGKPDSRKWSMYDGPGHGGNGRRSPDAFSVADGMLRIHGDEGGKSGGMAWRGGQYCGRWEARMRTPAGDGGYHPVLLLWPDAEDFPVGGEIDYAEIFRADRQEVNCFLHFGRDNSQTSSCLKIDATQWHHYAVSWTEVCVKAFIDGVQFFEDCQKEHLPPRKMHGTIQLDAFRGTGPYIASDMYVDWFRVYGS